MHACGACRHCFSNFMQKQIKLFTFAKKSTSAILRSVYCIRARAHFYWGKFNVHSFETPIAREKYILVSHQRHFLAKKVPCLISEHGMFYHIQTTNRNRASCVNLLNGSKRFSRSHFTDGIIILKNFVYGEKIQDEIWMKVFLSHILKTW